MKTHKLELIGHSHPGENDPIPSIGNERIKFKKWNKLVKQTLNDTLSLDVETHENFANAKKYLYEREDI